MALFQFNLIVYPYALWRTVMIFWQNYEVYFYQLKQFTYHELTLSISNFNLSSILIFFFLGIITSLTPCFISMIPLSIVYLNVSENQKVKKNIFIIGLSSSTLLTLILISLLNYKYINYINHLPILPSFLLCLLALNLLNIIDLSFLSRIFDNFIANNNVIYNHNLYYYVSGLMIGLSSLPCSSSFVWIISFWLSNSINVLWSLVYLFFYSFGYLFSMFVIFRITFNYTKIFLLSTIWETFVPLGGCIILTISFFNILENLLA